MPRKNRDAGSGYVVRGGRRSDKTRLPACSFGTACTRPDCIYTHPPRDPSKKASAPVCVPFLIGACAYGGACRNAHVSDEKAKEGLLRSYKSKACKFGETCANAQCLFYHPPRTNDAPVLPPSAAFAEAFVPGLGLTTVIGGSGGVFRAVEDVQEEETRDMHDGAVYMPPSAALLEKRAAVSSVRASTRKVIPVPQHLYVDDFRRNAETAFAIADPIDKLVYVNASTGNRRGACDLHFQKIKDACGVLDVLFFESAVRGAGGEVDPLASLREMEYIWLFTGVGAHVGSGGRAYGASLESVVADYLNDNGLHYDIGSLGGKQGGAFRVRNPQKR